MRSKTKQNQVKVNINGRLLNVKLLEIKGVLLKHQTLLSAEKCLEKLEDEGLIEKEIWSIDNYIILTANNDNVQKIEEIALKFNLLHKKRFTKRKKMIKAVKKIKHHQKPFYENIKIFT